MDESVERDLRSVDIRRLNEAQYRHIQSRIRILQEVKSDLLVIGRAAVGKSTLGETLTNGKIQGSDGPTGGNARREDTGFILTKSIVNTEGEEIGNVHDTVGFDDGRYDLQKMKQELRQFHGRFYEDGKSNCTTILCVPWQDRIHSHELAFEVCHSLKKWDEVIICVTKCDQISSSIKRLPPDERKDAILAERVQWEESIMRKLELMGVQNFNKKKIVFTCDEYEENLVDPQWYYSLAEALTEAAMATIPADGGVGFSAFCTRFAKCLAMGWQFTTRLVARDAERNHNMSVVPVDEDETDKELQQVPQDNQNFVDPGCSPKGVGFGKSVALTAAGGVSGAGIGALVGCGVVKLTATAAVAKTVCAGAAVGGVIGIAGIAGVLVALYFYNRYLENQEKKNQ